MKFSSVKKNAAFSCSQLSVDLNQASRTVLLPGDTVGTNREGKASLPWLHVRLGAQRRGGCRARPAQEAGSATDRGTCSGTAQGTTGLLLAPSGNVMSYRNN